MPVDQNYVDGVNEWVKQRELSIEHSEFSNEYYAKSIVNFQRTIEANNAQIQLDRAMIEQQKKTLAQYIQDND